MRAALVLLLLIGCAKKSAEPGARQATEPAATNESAPVTTGTAAPGSAPEAPPPPPGPKNEAAKGGEVQQAREQARADGVLGPTEAKAFAVKGTVTIKRATAKAIDEAVRSKLDKLQACYDHALEMQEALAGELTLSIKDGKATLGKSTLKHAELEKCVADVLVDLPKTKATLVLAFKRE